MKKKLYIVIAVIALIFILVGVGFVFFYKEEVMIPTKIKNKVMSLNTEYQQQVILKVEEALSTGYVVNPGKSEVDTSLFLKDVEDYASCQGKVQFDNTNGNISYTLSTSCKDGDGDLDIDYQVATTTLPQFEYANVFKVSDGYFLVGNVDVMESKEESTGNALLIKFDNQHKIVFTKKLSDIVTDQQNVTSYINIVGIQEAKDGYYVVGNTQNVQGGDFENIIAELKSKNKDTAGFEFIFKYDKQGNLVSENTVDLAKSKTFSSSIIGMQGDDLYLSANGIIIKFNTQNHKFQYIDTKKDMYEGNYLKDGKIYGYRNMCNYEGEDSNIKDEMIFFDVQGKEIWKKEKKEETKMEKDGCSSYFSRWYSLGDQNAIVYDNNKKIDIYSDSGRLQKTLDFSNMSKKKDGFSIENVEKFGNLIKVFYNDEENFIIDTFDSNYEHLHRYSNSLYDPVSTITEVTDIEGFLSTEKQFSNFEIVKNNQHVAFLRVNYHYES